MRNKNLIVTLLVIFSVYLIYYFFFSLTSALKENGFNKEDIVSYYPYELQDNRVLDIYLLENKDRIKFVTIEQNFYIFHDSFYKPQKVNGDINGEFITEGMMTREVNEKTNRNRVRFHILIAKYVKEKIPELEKLNPRNFVMDIEYFPRDKHYILVINSSSINDSIGTIDVLEYIESELGEPLIKPID